MHRPPPVYDAIGAGYHDHRRADPRIARQLTEALGDARSVVDVGAGTGSYEPRERRVVGVEPSPVMIRQRPSGAAPVVRGVAEALPFAEHAFEAAMSVFSVHHWSDLAAGLDEMARVARRRVVLTWDQAVSEERNWLLRDYLPELIPFERAKHPALEVICERLGAARVEPVPIPHDCTDGFFVAYWRRPHAYLDPDRRRAISAFSLVADDVVAGGLERLRADLASEAWSDRYQHLLDLESYDAGYRLVVAG